MTRSGMYEWIEALHLIAVMVWMAGMLLMPWLFVYHRDIAIGSDTSGFLKVVERRLLRTVVDPAMILVWITGPYLAWSAHLWMAGWFQAKFALVFALSGIHGLYARWVKDFAADRPRKSRETYRLAAAIPSVVMIAVVILVIVKPF
jgi:protoporphyrinogen IX oxidase